MAIGLVIFDLAGTVIDFGCRAPLEAFLEAFADSGFVVSETLARKPMGTHKKEHVREILSYPEIADRYTTIRDGAPDEDLVELVYARFQSKLTEILPDFATLTPGVLETLDWLRREEISIGATTGYVRRMVDVLAPTLEAIGLTADSIVCADEVIQSRPAPWGCFRLAEKYNVFPMTRCLKIGDTPADILEGLNASMPSLGVSDSGNEVGLDFETWSGLSNEDRLRRRSIAESKLRAVGATDVLTGIDHLPEWIETREKGWG